MAPGKTLQTNFAFLREHGESCLGLGLQAEQYFPSDPNTCLLKLRQLTETLTQHLAARAGLYSSTEESQFDLLARLQNHGLVPREISAGLLAAAFRGELLLDEPKHCSEPIGVPDASSILKKQTQALAHDSNIFTEFMRS